MLFPSLSEFSSVYCDPHKGFGIVNKAEIEVFLEVSIEERFLSEISNVSAQTQGESWRVIRMHVDNKLV